LEASATEFWALIIVEPLTGIVALAGLYLRSRDPPPRAPPPSPRWLPLTAMLLRSGGRRMAYPAHRGRRRSGRVGRPAGDRFRAAPGSFGVAGPGFLAIRPMNEGVILISGLVLGIWVYLVLLHGRY
jgi:hypothetical protein